MTFVMLGNCPYISDFTDTYLNGLIPSKTELYLKLKSCIKTGPSIVQVETQAYKLQFL